MAQNYIEGTDITYSLCVEYNGKDLFDEFSDFLSESPIPEKWCIKREPGEKDFVITKWFNENVCKKDHALGNTNCPYMHFDFDFDHGDRVRSSSVGWPDYKEITYEEFCKFIILREEPKELIPLIFN